MGKILELTEGDPVEVHKGLRSLIYKTIDWLNAITGCSSFGIHPGVQFNSRDFYFRESEILKEILELYENKKMNEKKVYGTIHQSNGIQPIKACKEFIEELIKNLDLHLQLGTNNLTVHLPVDKENRIAEICEILTSDAIINQLEIIRNKNPNISIDFENNHHGSFFGNLDHCIALFQSLKDKLYEIGKKDIYPILNICFDSGHFFIDADKMNYNKTAMLENFFETMKAKINTLHIHTNDGITDRHFLLGRSYDNFLIKPAINKEKIQENTTLILETLPMLNLKQKNNWNIVSETDSPYKIEDLIENFKLIFEHL